MLEKDKGDDKSENCWEISVDSRLDLEKQMSEVSKNQMNNISLCLSSTYCHWLLYVSHTC
jgi:hypothetical protein